MPLDWAIFFFGVVLSMYASATESAFINASMGRLLKHEAQEPKLWTPLRQLKEKPENLYATLLAANTLAHMLVSSFGAKLLVAHTFLGDLQKQGGSLSPVLITLLIGLGAFLVLELMPKMYGTFHFERLLRRLGPKVAWLVRLMRWPLWPVVAIPRLLMAKGNRDVFQHHSLVSEEDLIHMMEMGHKEGSFAEQDVKVLKNIFASSEVEAEDIMVPRINMHTVSAADTLEEAVGLFTRHGVSRLPVYDGTIDHMAGVLYAKDLLGGRHPNLAQPVSTAMRRGVYLIPETKKVLALLEEFRQKNLQMAVVVDEYGGTVGLLTLEDVLEEIVGEIFDEHDVVKPQMVKLASGHVRYQGSYPLAQFAAHCDLVQESELENFETVAGWLSGRLGHLPTPGEEHREGLWRFVVESVARQRIQRFLVMKEEAEG